MIFATFIASLVGTIIGGFFINWVQWRLEFGDWNFWTDAVFWYKSRRNARYKP